MKLLVIVAALALLACSVQADLYLHTPRGSNNRYDTNNNAPANRIFDSQNNNQAGYNPGPVAEDPMNYYKGSILMMEWTAQHGCGDNPKVHCEIVIQQRCDEEGWTPAMRNGDTDTRAQDNDDAEGNTYWEPYPANQFDPTADRALHEPYANYYACERRERNRGLYIADENVNGGGTSRATRQNPNGGRSGYECAEERDYYPYWHPSYWKDIVVLTDNVTRCEMYQAESQNVIGKSYCTNINHNRESSCTANGGTWMISQSWAETEASLGVPEEDRSEAPMCRQAPWSRQNMHGNTVLPADTIAYAHSQGIPADNLNRQMAHENITINPRTVTGTSSACVLRIRYNMSSDDTRWEMDWRLNGDASPIEDDPYIDIGIGTELQMQVNTNQFGRTFQDRSHIFRVSAPPAAAATAMAEGQKLWNLQVRGKRGGNAGNYPNNEYDFTPNILHLERGDMVHFQWKGSNNNPNGSDRSNVVMSRGDDTNYVMSIDDADYTMFNGGSMVDPTRTPVEIARRFATGDPTGNNTAVTDPNLQDARTYFSGDVIQYNDDGIYHYMSTKNNAFSNRQQKAALIVGDIDTSSTGEIVGAVVGATVGVVAIVAVVGAVIFFGGASAIIAAFKGKKSKSSAANSRF